MHDKVGGKSCKRATLSSVAASCGEMAATEARAVAERLVAEQIAVTLLEAATLAEVRRAIQGLWYSHRVCLCHAPLCSRLYHRQVTVTAAVVQSLQSAATSDADWGEVEAAEVGDQPASLSHRGGMASTSSLAEAARLALDQQPKRWSFSSLLAAMGNRAPAKRPSVSNKVMSSGADRVKRQSCNGTVDGTRSRSSTR